MIGVVILGASADIKVIHMAPCKRCGKALQDEWRFCPYCKTKVETFFCICCMKEIKSHWRFCPYCRTKLKKGLKHRLIFDDGNQWLRELLRK
ncbi:zinc ribbon domain-containing protein [Thermotalea metallivorans]|uniref:zinc ribbon domain-containing protein n=1 Tax=Thermotalea metallivorans TaxID=520762 RepID=UPI0009F81FB5